MLSHYNTFLPSTHRENVQRCLCINDSYTIYAVHMHEWTTQDKKRWHTHTYEPQIDLAKWNSSVEKITITNSSWGSCSYSATEINGTIIGWFMSYFSKNLLVESFFNEWFRRTHSISSGVDKQMWAVIDNRICARLVRFEFKLMNFDQFWFLTSMTSNHIGFRVASS